MQAIWRHGEHVRPPYARSLRLRRELNRRCPSQRFDSWTCRIALRARPVALRPAQSMQSVGAIRMPDCIGLRGRLAFQHEGFRAAALACLDVRHLPAGCHGSILRHERIGFTFDGGGIAVLDEQPVVSLAAIAITLHAHEHPAAVHALAFHDEFQLTLAQLLLGGCIAFGRPETAVPELDGAAAVFALRDSALEVTVVERVIFYLDRETLVARVR